MGGPSTSSSSQSSFPQIPGWLLPYYKRTAHELEGAQKNLPNLTSLYGNVPLLNVPGMTSDMSNLVNQFQKNVGLNADEMSSSAGLRQFIDSNGKPSSATNAALKEFSDLQAPEVMQQAALMGQGNSGAALSSLAQAQESALVPFMQQDLSNSLAASGQLGQLGLAEGQQTLEQLQSALTAAGLPREVAMQQAQALFDKQQQQFQFAQGIQGGGQSQFPSLLGQISNGNMSSSQPKF